MPHPPRLTGDARLLFATHFIHLFAYSAHSVVLAFDLGHVGLSEARVGLLLTDTLICNTIISSPSRPR